MPPYHIAKVDSRDGLHKVLERLARSMKQFNRLQSDDTNSQTESFQWQKFAGDRIGIGAYLEVTKTRWHFERRNRACEVSPDNRYQR